MPSQILPGSTIAIVDDDEGWAEETELELKDAGFKSLAIVEGSYKKAEQLALYIANNAQYAICDHRLAPYGLANFYGSELVAILYDFKIPSILITQYTDMDIDVSIRKYRSKIPVLLSREEVSASNLERGIEDCISELAGKVLSTRKPHRTIVRITNIDRESGEDVVDAFVPGWNPHKAVRFPASLIPGEIRDDALKPGVRLFAHVNIGADKSDDLYFDKFELAPEPDDDDGLA